MSIKMFKYYFFTYLYSFYFFMTSKMITFEINTSIFIIYLFTM